LRSVHLTFKVHTQISSQLARLFNIQVFEINPASIQRLYYNWLYKIYVQYNFISLHQNTEKHAFRTRQQMVQKNKHLKNINISSIRKNSYNTSKTSILTITLLAVMRLTATWRFK
jgi:hypothetical protein